MNVHRIVTETAFYHVMIMFDYIILARRIARDLYHHFHTIKCLEVVLYLDLLNISIHEINLIFLNLCMQYKYIS